MNKSLAIGLKKEAERAAIEFSKPDRERNFAQETFTVHEIVPLSEMTAAVIFNKSSGKKAVMFFYFRKDEWLCFFPTDSHILGMEGFKPYKDRVERENYFHNFEEI